MSTFNLLLGAIFLVLGAWFVGTGSRRAEDYKRAGRRGWPARRSFYIALGVGWLALGAVRLLLA